MFRRKEPPRPSRLDERPPAELGPCGPKSTLTVWAWRIGLPLACAVIGYASGVVGLIVVSALSSIVSFWSLIVVLDSGDGDEGWILFFSLTGTVTLFVLLPTYLGYAAAALLSL